MFSGKSLSPFLVMASSRFSTNGFGVAIAYFLFPGLSFQACLFYGLTFPLTALLVKRLLFISPLKARPV